MYDQYALLDTGTSLMYMPTAEYNAFYQSIMRTGINCRDVNQHGTMDKFCKCNTNKDPRLPVLSFNIGKPGEEQIVKMTGEDYMSWDPFYKDCILRVHGNFKWEKVFMFGIPFLQGYYAIHDLDNHKIGLVR